MRADGRPVVAEDRNNGEGGGSIPSMRTLRDTPRVGPRAPRGRGGRVLWQVSHTTAIRFSRAFSLSRSLSSFRLYDCSSRLRSRGFAFADSFIGISLPPPTPSHLQEIPSRAFSRVSLLPPGLTFSRRVKYSRRNGRHPLLSAAVTQQISVNARARVVNVKFRPPSPRWDKGARDCRLEYEQCTSDVAGEIESRLASSPVFF